ncbi:hypothetical protein N7462_003486 [Penicillium macrosclerotiorum]|uniref:uncharacterized protein n=1 Tax=Penicillium macrosclerotiorum TaxID=303699 RepID=UPI002549634A|nr:uncharacterized protein N7462_003486 [Penicillium macrosclerotiorum]KAJ5689094.1 hypothetical protein N7462_003486 [Penicillium macrosclerotiorum]
MQHNISPIVYEIRSKPTTLGGAIGIPPNGLRLLHRLGVFEKMKQKGAETSDMAFHSTNGGDLGQMSMISWTRDQIGFGYLRIKRADLMDVLLSAAEEAAIPIIYNKSLSGITENDGKVTVSFSDESYSSADFLLGCDGIHSAVRRLWVDPECVPEYSGIANMFSLIPTSQLSSAAPLKDKVCMTLTSDGLFGVSPADSSEHFLYWFFSREIPIPVSGDIRDGWEERGQKEIESCKAFMLDLLGEERSAWIDGLREIVLKTATMKFYPVYKIPPGRPWSKGRCLLIGDAAHAMPPHASQGYSMALEDIFLFSKLLGTNANSLADGLRVYKEKRKLRIDKMLKIAERNRTIRHKISPFRLRAIEKGVGAVLWVYKMIHLEKLGLGQRPLIYCVDDEELK